MKRKNMLALFLRRALLISSALLMLSSCAVESSPFTNEERSERIESDLAQLFENQDPVQAPISLEEAIARALKYNLDHRLKMMESAVSLGQVQVTSLDMLPRITANAGYSSRSNESGSRSQSLLDGSQSLVFSTSQEKTRFMADLSMVWNVIDFGVTYTQAQQEADRALIAEERRRKIIHNITQDVRYAYWRAIGSQRLLDTLSPLTEEVKQALANAKQVEEKRLQSPLDSLNYQRGLLETLRDLNNLKRELYLAKTELAALMNIPPGRDFDIIIPKDDVEVPDITVSIEEMEKLALNHRPELREEDYQSRISRLDVRKEILRMLPGIELSGDFSYDENQFLYNNQWAEAGLKLTWNLFNLIAGKSRYDLAEAKESLADARRLALSMAVISQVHVAKRRFELARDEFKVSSDLNKVQARIFKQVQSAKRAEKITNLDFIQNSVSTILARLRRDSAYAELQNAMGSLFVSIGADPMMRVSPDAPLSEITKAVAESSKQWEHGRFTLEEFERLIKFYHRESQVKPYEPLRPADGYDKNRQEIGKEIGDEVTTPQIQMKKNTSRPLVDETRLDKKDDQQLSSEPAEVNLRKTGSHSTALPPMKPLSHPSEEETKEVEEEKDAPIFSIERIRSRLGLEPKTEEKPEPIEKAPAEEAPTPAPAPESKAVPQIQMKKEDSKTEAMPAPKARSTRKSSQIQPNLTQENLEPTLRVQEIVKEKVDQKPLISKVSKESSTMVDHASPTLQKLMPQGTSGVAASSKLSIQRKTTAE